MTGMEPSVMLERYHRAKKMAALIKSGREFTIGDLAQQLDISNGYARSLSKRLCDMGFVEREECRRLSMMIFRKAKQ